MVAVSVVDRVGLGVGAGLGMGSVMRSRPNRSELAILAVMVAVVMLVGWYILGGAHWNAG